MKKGFDYVGVGVCCLCHDGKENIIFLKRGKNARDEHGNWDIVGGGIEFGDSIENTIHKEVMEELGSEVISYEFLGYFDAHREYDGQPTHWVQLAFKVLVNPEKVKLNEPHKFDEMGWFRLNSLPSPIHSQFPKFLEKFRDKLY
ncbi:NUDIX domain-containing protein [Candidatus Woesearchaeota archaeon]|nr:NUDIX domain-containing protein [Candidatus Woesearchaeota archaeon]